MQFFEGSNTRLFVKGVFFAADVLDYSVMPVSFPAQNATVNLGSPLQHPLETTTSILYGFSCFRNDKLNSYLFWL